MRFTSKANVILLVSLTPFLLTGCQRAPAFNIEGSFFPGWLVCVVAGIIFAVCIRGLLCRVGLEREIKPSILIYPCVALSFALTTWLIFFR
ncbi:YtcA family lipoprotein [Edaphobacter aggregans]|uniref:YtcA family lipoprotein n=1 Tax=Edaphobacter aggregans TaxID=570835 RepID=UPI001FE242C1|nr:YtcA family lipoprotein [Edaphobacter aggregans]